MGPGGARQGQWGQWRPWHPPLPYLVQGLVRIWVSVRKRGFFPEPLPEGVLPDLRRDDGAQEGEPGAGSRGEQQGSSRSC